jgi:hypothetical protein
MSRKPAALSTTKAILSGQVFRTTAIVTEKTMSKKRKPLATSPSQIHKSSVR